LCASPIAAPDQRFVYAAVGRRQILVQICYPQICGYSARLDPRREPRLTPGQDEKKLDESEGADREQ
jgi:hypothetical protein